MIQGELSFFETTVFFQTLMYWKLLPSLKLLQFLFFSTTLTPILNKPKQIDGLVIVHYQGHTNMIVDGGGIKSQWSWRRTLLPRTLRGGLCLDSSGNISPYLITLSNSAHQATSGRTECVTTALNLISPCQWRLAAALVWRIGCCHFPFRAATLLSQQCGLRLVNTS